MVKRYYKKRRYSYKKKRSYKKRRYGRDPPLHVVFPPTKFRPRIFGIHGKGKQNNGTLVQNTTSTEGNAYSLDPSGGYGLTAGLPILAALAYAKYGGAWRDLSLNWNRNPMKDLISEYDALKSLDYDPLRGDLLPALRGINHGRQISPGMRDLYTQAYNDYRLGNKAGVDFLNSMTKDPQFASELKDYQQVVHDINNPPTAKQDL